MPPQVPSSTTVTVSTGTLSGSVVDGVRRFLGIPYAAAPFGAERFRAPQPAESWRGVRAAREFGPTPPQDPYGGSLADILPSIQIPGDDILTVNVWSPLVETRGGSPVVLWIHGGALERGTAALDLYDGSSFARDGVVFASFNYRLGAEGFSVLAGGAANAGLQDAAAALDWVRREIAVFGGDPTRITLMGESAGGALVAALLSDPARREGVVGAIIQSGPLTADSPERAARASNGVAKKLGIPPTREAFVDVSPADLLAARRALAAGSTPLRGAPGYSLAVDEETLPASPHDALVDLEIPLLIGTNTDEYRLWFAPDALAKIGSLALTAARLAYGVSGRAVRAYRAAWPGASNGEVLGQLATDILLRAPAVRLARRRRAATYVYEFAWPSPVRDLRAAHSLELAFTFDALDRSDAQRIAGADAPAALAQAMHDDWVRFIHGGEPGWAPIADAGGIRRYDTVTTDIPLPRGEALDLLPPERVR